MTLDPHGREPSAVRDMMNPKKDNLKPPHSQITHTCSQKNIAEINCSASLFVMILNRWFSLCLYFSCSLPRCFLSVSHFSLLSGPALYAAHHHHFQYVQYLTMNSPTCSPAVTMDNLSGWLWQIKPHRYMAITFTGWHKRKEGKQGEGRSWGRYGNRSGTGIERETKTHTDGRWDLLSAALYFQTWYSMRIHEEMVRIF